MIHFVSNGASKYFRGLTVLCERKLTYSAHQLACPLYLVVKDCASALENSDDLHTQDQTADSH